MNAKAVSTGKELHNQVKAGFVLQGDTLGAWCRRNGIARQNAAKALNGSWKGPKAKKLLSRLLVASRNNEDICDG